MEKESTPKRPGAIIIPGQPVEKPALFKGSYTYKGEDFPPVEMAVAAWLNPGRNIGDEVPTEDFVRAWREAADPVLTKRLQQFGKDHPADIEIVNQALAMREWSVKVFSECVRWRNPPMFYATRRHVSSCIQSGESTVKERTPKADPASPTLREFSGIPLTHTPEMATVAPAKIVTD